MSKRNKRPTRPKNRSSARRRPQRREPDLVEQIADALDTGEPLALLDLASGFLDAVDPRNDDPYDPDPDRPTREELVESLFASPMPETSALLAAIAALTGDDVLRRRVARELAARAHTLPSWLADLPSTVADPDSMAITEPLGDGDDVLVSVTLPGGRTLVAVVLIEHNLGSIVKDAFVVPGPIDEVLSALETADDAPDLTVGPLTAADAKVRITDAMEVGARTYPPIRTGTWPALRPLVEWMLGLLPDGGTGYEYREWTDEETDELARRFRASPFAVDDPDDLLSPLLRFGTGHGPGDPLHWSPTAVEILLLDWIPRKLMFGTELLAEVPVVLRAFIRFCHHERGIRVGLTDETLAAVDELEPEYQELIRSERFDGEDEDPEVVPGVEAVEVILEMLAEAVGGEEALDTLDTDPLPDEAFDWDAVPADVRSPVGDVLPLVERCCAELLDAEYRTACRRLLADVAANDPSVFGGRERPSSTAAAVCWTVGKANGVFDTSVAGRTLPVKKLMKHFGLTGGAAQRSAPLLRALGVGPTRGDGDLRLGTPRYLTSGRRVDLVTIRDRCREFVD